MHLPHDPSFRAIEPDPWAERQPLGESWDQPVPEQARRQRHWLLQGFAAVLLLVVVLVGWLAFTAPLSKSLEPIAPPQITLLASDGTPIARNGAEVEAPVQIRRLPPHVPHAFLAIEDRRFYHHWGIDPYGMVRALWTNLTTGRTQGGSTITQQLAKFTFLTPERNLTRKAREMLIAFWLEIWLTKDEILERYLSNAYFGDNTYGLRAASLHYFNRQPERLSPGQAAMLAGLVQAPSRLAPTHNYTLARKRMQLVVHAMVAAGYLTTRQAAAIRAPRLDVRTGRVLPTGTYFADWALPEARKLGEAGYARQTITTTLDSRLQAAARAAVQRASLGGAQAALVAMRPNGEVVAMVGGKDYAASPFNRATQSQRQPGSTFKLFVYLAALRDGWSPSDPIDNSPITTGSYRPKNAGGGYSRTITLEDAFARSSNVAAVRLLGEVGSDAVIKAARSLGVRSRLTRGDPSVALGTSTMSLLELTAAYAGVAGNRFPVVPRPFTVEEKGWLKRLLAGESSDPEKVHRNIEQLLAGAVSHGTGRAAALPWPAYGKTGTSQDSRDALFVGYSRDLVVGVWVGRDDNAPLRGVTGGGVPAQIWRDFMLRAFGRRTAPQRRVDPRGPVEPQDVPEGAQIPLGDNARVRLDQGGAVVSGQIGDLPVDVRINSDGVAIGSADAERMRSLRDEAVERAREEQRRLVERLREASRDTRDEWDSEDEQ
jgi:penicillin-binding protein 1A